MKLSDSMNEECKVLSGVEEFKLIGKIHHHGSKLTIDQIIDQTSTIVYYNKSLSTTLIFLLMDKLPRRHWVPFLTSNGMYDTSNVKATIEELHPVKFKRKIRKYLKDTSSELKSENTDEANYVKFKKGKKQSTNGQTYCSNCNKSGHYKSQCNKAKKEKR